MAAYSTPRGVLPLILALFVFVQATVALHGSNHHAHRSPSAMAKHLEETRSILAERSNNIAITGVQGTVGRRLEIRELKNNADAWNLFVLGMEKFQAKPHSDRLSYYQIAGVHGRPYVSWNNFPSPLVNQAGFCPHAQPLFGSWHRPYLAVYEQAWYQSVQEVIATFPPNQQQRWRNAGVGLRMPYFDWAMYPGNGQPAVPTTIRDQTVTVTKPQGQVTIKNPLYSFTLGDTLPGEMGGGPWNNFPTTLRRPVGNPTRSNNNEMNAVFGSQRISLRDRLFNIFMTGASFGSVSTSAIGARTKTGTDSFESVHDAIHVNAGGDSGGYMYYLDISAFDPIFWLHHTNIDRLLAMYQKVSPNTWIPVSTINRPMAQWNQGETKNSYTPLKPFTKNSNGDYFTSEDIRDTRVLGYEYKETAGNANGQSVINAVNSLYGPNAPRSKKRDLSGQYEGRPFREGDYQTVLSIVADKFVMDGSYSIHCYLGSGNSTSNTTSPTATNVATGTAAPISTSTGAPSAPASNSTSEYPDYVSNPNYVGGYGVLGGSAGHGGNSSNAVITEGCIPLTTALQGKQAAGYLASMQPQDVQAYLKDNLYYKVIGPGGAEIPADSVPSLHIYVQTAPVTPAASPDELPTIGEYVKLPEVTKGKPASAPYTYVPSPIDYYSEATPEGQPTSPNPPPGVFPYPTTPESEQGFCVSKQKIEYVDPSGNFLYAEMR